MISVVGLGPDVLEHTSKAALDTLRSAARVYLRTEHHPAAQELMSEGVEVSTFDHIYETSETFEQVYDRISDELIARSREGVDVVYAVPGHPLIGERSVELLIKKAASLGVEIHIEGSMSFIESCLEALAASVGRGLAVFDALEIDDLSPDPSIPLLVYQVYSREIASSLKLRLMDFYPDEYEVSVVTASEKGTVVDRMPLYKLDRREFDHLASVFVPQMDEPMNPAAEED